MLVLGSAKVFLSSVRGLNHSQSILSRLYEELVTRSRILAGLLFPRSRDTVSPPPPQHLPKSSTVTSAAESSVLGGFFLWAVPKKRTSHSRKRMRMTHKYLKPKRHYQACSKCGGLKLMHTLCGQCFKETMKLTAEVRRQRAAEDTKIAEE